MDSTFGYSVSITMDDPHVQKLPLFSSKERNQKILDALTRHKLQALLFVCGKRIDNPEGKELLKTWDKAGHLIGNHSYSHLYFPGTDLAKFIEDAFAVEQLISGLRNFVKIFRFPFLKEGDTKEKRDAMRAELHKRGYKLGHVTIDASDWSIENRLIKKLKHDPKADLRPYRDFYLKHIWERTLYYNDLAQKVYGHKIDHTLLIHHTLLNALFLNDLLEMFQNKGWQLKSPEAAFQSTIFKDEPDIIPAGEGLVWAKAKEIGKFESILRYPAEDEKYEAPEMDKLSL